MQCDATRHAFTMHLLSFIPDRINPKQLVEVSKIVPPLLVLLHPGEVC